MIKTLAIVIAISLAGCGGGGSAISRSETPAAGGVADDSPKTATRSAESEPSAAGGVSEPSAAGDRQVPAAPVYVGMVNLPGHKMGLALFDGQFLVDRGCLIFRSGMTDYLPVFSTALKVKVERNYVDIDGQIRRLGEMVMRNGAHMSGGVDRYLVEPIPASCTQKVLRF